MKRLESAMMRRAGIRWHRMSHGADVPGNGSEVQDEYRLPFGAQPYDLEYGIVRGVFNMPKAYSWLHRLVGWRRI